MGDTANYEHRGVAPRALTQMFGEINSRIEFEYKVTVTYMELYNERIFDLLTDLSNPDVASDYTIAEEKDGRGTFVRGLTTVEVKDENDALNLLFRGELSRTTATHKLNRKSNRSHSVFTLYLEQRQRSGVSERVVHSKLCLVDLAGSERLKKTMDGVADDTIRKESMAINQSLTYLEQCVIKLASKASHIPYRQSKLTNLLKDCLGANCNTLMIACMWGESSHLEETVSTLRLASRMMKVQNETSTVETIDSSALIRKQNRIIKALKQELLMHDALVERTGVGYEPYTPEQQSSMGTMLERYVEAPEAEEEDVLNIVSYRQMLETCKQFKKMVLHARADTAAAHEMALAGGGVDALGRPITSDFGEGGSNFAETKIADDFDPDKTPFVGQAEAKSGFSIGAAASDSRPVGGVEGSARFNAREDKGVSRQSMGSPGDRKSIQGLGSPKSGAMDGGGFSPMAGGQSAMFESYTKSEGHELYQDFSAAKAELKEYRYKSKETSVVINHAKANIDRLQEEIGTRKQSRIELLRKSGLKSSETEDIVDEEEFSLMKELREAKRTYKNSYQHLQKIKGSINDAQMKVDRMRDDLASGFMGNTNMGDTDAMAMEMAGGADVLDDQEAFDRLETQRVVDQDPDSLAYFHAQKTRRALMTQNSASIKYAQKNKRHHR